MDPLDSTDVDAQIHSEFKHAVSESFASRRPVLTHLNADTTWLVSIPTNTNNALGASEGGSRKRRKTEDGDHDTTNEGTTNNARNYFHILIDPWLKGPQADVTRFLSQQWHKEESAVQSIEEVLDAIADLEDMASYASRRSHDHDTPQKGRGRSRKRRQDSEDPPEQSEEEKRKIDLIIVSHEFTDHMHKDTLLEIAPEVPVFATSIAAGRIRAWKHFKTVIDMPKFRGKGQDWRKSSTDPLPPWLSITRLDSSQSDVLNYHSAVLLAFPATIQHNHDDEDNNNNDEERGGAEAIIYTPHGITASQLTPLTTASPAIKTLALIHTMHDITLSGAQLNLGAHNGLKAQRLTRAKYWIGTHDEVKSGFGIVSWVLRRKVVSLEEALRLEIQESFGGSGKEGEGRREMERLEEVVFRDLGNGESLVLE